MFRVSGLGFGVCTGFRIWGLGFTVKAVYLLRHGSKSEFGSESKA